MKNRMIGLAAMLGCLGVVFGAFGAHTLREKITPGSLDVLQTGVVYLFIHVLAALLTTSVVAADQYRGLIRSATILFLTGVLLFSGSLFLIATAELTAINTNYIGFLTPLGGLCFILGWLMFASWAFRQPFGR